MTTVCYSSQDFKCWDALGTTSEKVMHDNKLRDLVPDLKVTLNMHLAKRCHIIVFIVCY